jgi:citrate synthase
MASINEFFASVKKGVGKLGNKVEKVADNTSLRLKLTAVDSKLTELYTEFGKLSYENVRGEVCENAQKRMETLIAMIDGKVAEKKSLEDEIERRKQEAAREKAEEEAREAAEEAAEEAEEKAAEKAEEEAAAAEKQAE